MKESIQELKEKLAKYPTANCQIEADRIEVPPSSDDGFAVSLYDCGNETIVSYGGWHQHFQDVEEAQNCFAFGLSTRCRLAVHHRGGFEYKWTIQTKDKNGAWNNCDASALLFFPFWRKKSVKYLQNDLWDGE
jgi:hypothetical protein